MLIMTNMIGESVCLKNDECHLFVVPTDDFKNSFLLELHTLRNPLFCQIKIAIIILRKSGVMLFLC